MPRKYQRKSNAPLRAHWREESLIEAMNLVTRKKKA